MKVKALIVQLCPTLCDPLGLYSPWNSPGQNTGVGSFSLLQGNLPNPGIEPRSLTLHADSLPSESQGKPLVFWMLSRKPGFSLSSFIFIKRLFSSSLLSAIRVVSSAYLRLLIFLPAVLISALLHSAQPFAWCTLLSCFSRVWQDDNIQPWLLLSQFGTSLFFHVQF